MKMYTGEMIRKLRLLKEFTQKGMAEEMGITQQAYSKLEKRIFISEEKWQIIVRILQYSEHEIIVFMKMLGRKNDEVDICVDD